MNYEQLKSESWEFYSRLEPVICPALQNEQIVFSHSGFNHLLRKGGVPRSHADQARRLRLLGRVVPMLSNAQAVAVHRYEEAKEIISRTNKKIRIPSAVNFWAFSEKHDGQLVTVVVRQINKGPKHFFSVMSRKASSKNGSGH